MFSLQANVEVELQKIIEILLLGWEVVLRAEVETIKNITIATNNKTIESGARTTKSKTRSSTRSTTTTTISNLISKFSYSIT
jgi:hypothetical protein